MGCFEIANLDETQFNWIVRSSLFSRIIFSSFWSREKNRERTERQREAPELAVPLAFLRWKVACLQSVFHSN